MVDRRLLAAALALSVLCTFPAPAWSQVAAAPPSARTTNLDPKPGTAPDPLAPPEIDKPAPAAPGAPAQTRETKPTDEIDPIVAMVRQRLALALPARAGTGDREDHAALVEFYAGATEPVWVGKDGLSHRGTQASGEIRSADDWGLQAAAFDLPAALPWDQASLEQLADAEIKLGVAVLKYARHARGGRVEPRSVHRIFDQKPTIYDPRTLISAIAAADASDAYLRDLHPKHPQFEKLRQVLLAARFMKGEYASSPSINSATRSDSEVQRLIVNMERWRWMPVNLGEFYVWDSVPEQMTMVLHKDKQVLAEKIVVGKPSSPTPIFTADMLFVIFRPSWGVPPGMKVHELWPQLKNAGGGWFFSSGASAVLKGHDLIVTQDGRSVNPDSINWNNVDIRHYEFTQPPGPKNLLGGVKFRFPNKHDVYMHDTPERHLFGGGMGQRVFSHGCMRVQNPIRLAEVLLANDKGWDKDKVAEYMRRGGEIRLTTPIPVHITYFTAWVGDDGKVAARPDVYAMDSRTASALQGRSLHVASSPITTGSIAKSSEPGKKVRSKRTQASKKGSGGQSFDLLGLFGISKK
jgi:L,D-transpeptidase YcbB